MFTSIGGFKGQIGLQYSKMDHNWDALRESPTSKTIRDTMRKHFHLAEVNGQKCCDIYMEIRMKVAEETYNTQYQPKYTEMETKLEEKETQMANADQVYDRAVRDKTPPPHVDGGGARAPFKPKIEMKLSPDELTDEMMPLEYNAWVAKL